ncbi:MAG: ABC transporter ATP-binding protein [Acidimicrobiales bacterium]
MNSKTLLSVDDLAIRFKTEDGLVQAVNGVTFDIERGEVFSVVGESGSGKSVTAMSILGLLPTPPADIYRGSIIWRGENLLEASPERMQEVRGGEIAMIFQDPLTALNPVLTVGRQVGEMVQVHEGLSKKDARAKAIEMLDLVGIPQPESRVDMHPHEFSGGMRQRAMIAMAISCNPDLLIADEPTTALDVTVQAQVLEVLLGIKDRIDSAIMLITHDLGVVAGVADDVMVMYTGRQVERGTVDEIFYKSSHPYTQGLMQSLPRIEGDDQPLNPIGGQPPSMINLPTGCSFHPRCRFVRPGACIEDVPILRTVDSQTEHESSCHYAREFSTGSLEPTR